VRITYGHTRIVVLWGKFAIKVARFHAFRVPVRLVQLLLTKEVEQKLSVYHEYMPIAIINYFLVGIKANRTEYHFSQIYTVGLAPTIGMFFWGLVLIQERGVAVKQTDEDLPSHPFWNAMLDEGGSREVAAKQFARFRDGILLVDFGRPELETLMR
jgi:hypothetical protein